MLTFLKQPMMRRVLYSLIPLYLYGLWMYGYRLLLVAAVVFVCGVATEWLFETFIRPALESKIPEGTLEAAYAKRKSADFDPLSLVATVQIKDVRVSRLSLDEE